MSDFDALGPFMAARLGVTLAELKEGLLGPAIEKAAVSASEDQQATEPAAELVPGTAG